MPEAKRGPITVPDLALVRDLYAAGRVSEALISCQQLLSEDPARPQAWAIAGMLSLKLGDLVHAEASYRRALALDPAFAEAHFNLGNLLVHLGRLEEGAEALGRAATLAPERAAMHTNLGAAQTRLGAHEAAERSLRRALALAPSPQAHRNLGTALRARGQLAAARDSFQRALELAPGWPKALQSLANTAMELGDWGLARDTCQRWLEIAPRNVEALGLMSIALDEQGDRAAADTLLNADRLLRRVAMEEAPGGGPLGAFNAALVREALADPSFRVPAASDPLYHCPTLLLSGDVGEEPGSAGAQLTVWVRRQIHAYVDALQRDLPDHPYVVGPAPSWSLKSWFAVLDREGQLEPHVHYESYVSAVYYAHVPNDMQGDREPGHFELSGGPSRFPCRHPRAPRTFAPKEGHLLLFPSYFYHRTLPFRASTPRVSIAFDAVPTDDSDATTAANKV